MGVMDGRSAYTTIIASRAGEALLAETLSSVVDQSLPPTRVIVVCDTHEELPEAWTDELRGVCSSVEFLLNPGVGQVSALNWGIQHAVTPYVAFLDSDDLWQPDKQRFQIEELADHPNADAAYCLAANFEDDGSGRRHLHDSAPSIMFTSTTFRRETFDRFGQLDPSATHFTWLYRWWGAAKERGISTRCVNYVGLHRRLHDGNSWTVQRGAAHRDLFREIRRHARQMTQDEGSALIVRPEVPGE